MHELKKREHTQLYSTDYSIPNREPAFMDKLSDAIKIFKRKQDFYAKILFNIPQRPLTSKHDTIDLTKVQQFQVEHEEMVTEEEEIFNTIKKYQKETFFMSKTYLYTVFVRINQIIQAIRQKINNKLKTNESTIKNGWQRIYDENKAALSQTYQNLIYFQTYDVVQILNVAKRKQNHRIYGIVPPKVRKSQITLNPLQRSDSSKMSKTNSIEIPSPSKKKQKLQTIIEAKIGKKKSKKIILQRKIQEKPKNHLKQLYGIMNIKNIKVEDRGEMQDDQMERNEMIRGMRQNYREKLQLRKIYLKLSRKKKEEKQQFQ